MADTKRTRPVAEQPDYVESSTEDECERFGRSEAERRAEERRAKLAALKRRIHDSGLAVRHYGGPEDLGELVLADLTTAVNQEFPPGPPTRIRRGILSTPVSRRASPARKPTWRELIATRGSYPR